MLEEPVDEVYLPSGWLAVVAVVSELTGFKRGLGNGDRDSSDFSCSLLFALGSGFCLNTCSEMASYFYSSLALSADYDYPNDLDEVLA